MRSQLSRLQRFTSAAGLALFTLVGSAASGPLWAAQHTVEIRAFKFKPDRLIVRPGDTVKWVNHDIAPHTATAVDKTWDTKRLNRGQSMIVTITEGMKKEYFCRFHPHMKAVIVFDASD